MQAFKFLARGAVGPFSGAVWPTPNGDEPGAWLSVDGILDLCRNGIHVCRANELAHWLHEELWELEIDGARIEGVDCLVVERARLIRRIDDWSAGGATRFATACIEHAANQLVTAPQAATDDLDGATSALRHGYPAIAAFQCAVAVARQASDLEAGYAAERAWQSSWISHASMRR